MVLLNSTTPADCPTRRGRCQPAALCPVLDKEDGLRAGGEPVADDRLAFDSRARPWFAGDRRGIFLSRCALQARVGGLQ